MSRGRRALVLLGTVALAGCGAGGEASTPTDADGNRYLEGHPGQEASALHLGAADCARLEAAMTRQTRRRLRREAEPTPPNSRCQIDGRGAHVSISLDAAYGARDRYSNRIAEQVQFNAADPAKLPHAVAGVGEAGAYNHYATWIPAYSTLWAVRGNRWLTVVYSLAGMDRRQRLVRAATLARLAFRLSAAAGPRPSASPARR